MTILYYICATLVVVFLLSHLVFDYTIRRTKGKVNSAYRDWNSRYKGSYSGLSKLQMLLLKTMRAIRIALVLLVSLFILIELLKLGKNYG